MIPATASAAAPTIIPDGESLTTELISRVAHDPSYQVELTPERTHYLRCNDERRWLRQLADSASSCRSDTEQHHALGAK